MVRLRRIPAIRAATLLAFTFAIPYFVLSLVFLLLYVPVNSFDNPLAPVLSLLFAWWVAALSIWLSIALGCALYNVIAGRLGGIELEFTTIPPRD